MRKTKWGILGCAHIALRSIIPAIKASKNAEVYGIASRNLKKAEEVAGNFGIPKTFSSYEKLLEDTDIEIVYIPLPNSMHKEWTIKSAKNGKHVLCEKPLSLNSLEAEEMVAACKANSKFLMDGFMYRFHPQHKKVFSLLDSGYIGNLKIVKATLEMDFMNNKEDIRFNPKMGGGGLMDLGVYCVNAARWFMKSEPQSVWALADFDQKTGVDIVLTAQMKFPENRVSLIQTGMSLPGESSYTLIGTEGMAVVDDAFVPAKDKRTCVSVYKNGFKPETFRIEPADQYQIEVEYFSECVKEDKPVEYPFENGLKNMKVVDALFASVQSGGVVQL
ncbi:Gfo/Idh/MocA family oxidoreductase [Candidatus Peregrinibacteria bacterium]|nr:Gfo/Idh/MocA family oxidoreductase [Candidatus Peregrinibacteria bacterium]